MLPVGFASSESLALGNIVVVRKVYQIFVNGAKSLIGRRLVQLITVCSLIETVQVHETGLVCKRAAGKDIDKGVKRLLGSYHVAIAVMGVRSIILHSIFLGRTVHSYLQRLKHRCGLGVFTGIEEIKGHLILGRHVIAFHHDFKLGLA